MDPDNNDRHPDPTAAAIIIGTGEVYGLEGDYREPPAKRPGVHRWSAFAAWYLSPEQAEAGHSPNNQILMDVSNLMSFGVACWDCELPYVEIHNQPCQAGDDWNGDS